MILYEDYSNSTLRIAQLRTPGLKNKTELKVQEAINLYILIIFLNNRRETKKMNMQIDLFE
jgi:hypothetical protein